MSSTLKNSVDSLWVWSSAILSEPLRLLYCPLSWPVALIVHEDTTVTVSVVLSLVDEDGVLLHVKPFLRDIKEASESDELFQQLTEAKEKGTTLQTKLLTLKPS